MPCCFQFFNCTDLHIFCGLEKKTCGVLSCWTNNWTGCFIQVVCGKRAGAFTRLLEEMGRYDSPDCFTADVKPDFKVSSLREVCSLLEANFELIPWSQTVLRGSVKVNGWRFYHPEHLLLHNNLLPLGSRFIFRWVEYAHAIVRQFKIHGQVFSLHSLVTE